MKQKLLSAALGLAVAFTAVGAAIAHPKLVAAIPAVDAAGVHSPHELRITFSEPVFPKFSGVVITGPGGAVAVGTPLADPADKRVLIIPIKAHLAAGRYEVVWHAVAADTHRVQGRYAFTVD